MSTSSVVLKQPVTAQVIFPTANHSKGFYLMVCIYCCCTAVVDDVALLYFFLAAQQISLKKPKLTEREYYNSQSWQRRVLQEPITT